MRPYIFLFFLSTFSLNAIAQSKFVGNWEGVLDIGGGRTMKAVFHVKDEGGKLSGTMDSPDQGVMGIPFSSVTAGGDTIAMEVSKINLKYAARIYRGDSLLGNFRQGAAMLTLNMKKTEKAYVLDRPQTPKPPFSYKTEDVTYSNADSSVKFGATLTTPNGNGPFPTLLLITGSGPQNRDEEILGHKPFAIIADHLTKQGYAVLRVDDRGVNKSTGDRSKATSADYAKDASAGLDYLLTRKEVDKKKLGLLGHSEGGMIAEILAAERKDVSFIVLIGAPGVPIKYLMREQNVLLREMSGLDSATAEHYGDLYLLIENDIINSKDSTEAFGRMAKTVEKWQGEMNDETVNKLGIGTKLAASQHLNNFHDMYKDTWTNYFVHFDPQPYLEKLSCKVLAINGEKDIQVPAQLNLNGIRTSLAKSRSKVYETKELEGLNHLLQSCKTCSVMEYGQLSESMSPMALQTISDWLDKNVK